MTVQSNITPESIVNDLRYLQLLSRSFPTIADASTEIINLEAILNLPKGTEHFLTDIHGEYEAFQHVLKNASGAVKRKVNEIFGNTLREAEKKEICTLIYYPEEKLQLVKAREKDLDDWYLITLNQLVKVCRVLLYYSGIIARIVHRAEQACLYQCNYQHDYHYQACRRFHYRYVQSDSASDY